MRTRLEVVGEPERLPFTPTGLGRAHSDSGRSRDLDRPGDQAGAPLVGEVRPGPADEHQHPLVEPHQREDVHHQPQHLVARNPLKRSQPRSATAARRPMVAMLPRLR